MMNSWKPRLLLLLASAAVMLDPHWAKQLGEAYAIPVGVFMLCIISFRKPLETLFEDHFVTNNYAFDPDGYNDEDPLRGLIPEFDLVDPSQPIARQC